MLRFPASRGFVGGVTLLKISLSYLPHFPILQHSRHLQLRYLKLKTTMCKCRFHRLSGVGFYFSRICWSTHVYKYRFSGLLSLLSFAGISHNLGTHKIKNYLLKKIFAVYSGQEVIYFFLERVVLSLVDITSCADSRDNFHGR